MRTSLLAMIWTNAAGGASLRGSSRQPLLNLDHVIGFTGLEHYPPDWRLAGVRAPLNFTN
jgi:hypothetical protein